MKHLRNYENFKAEYIESTRNLLTLTEFRPATQKFFAILGDGHMSYYGLTPKDDHFYYIDIDWIADNSRLYLLNEEKKPTNIEIINIGGVSLKNITAQVDIYYTAGNESSRQRNYTDHRHKQEFSILLQSSPKFGFELDI